MDTRTIEAYRFMRENAGYVVGHRAQGALQLARAEVLLHDAQDADVASVEWLDDVEPYEHGYYSDEEVAAKFESNEWVGPFGCVVKVGGEHVASLWGIVVGQAGTRDPYCRVVEAELASEVEDELRAALARTLDGAGLA